MKFRVHGRNRIIHDVCSFGKANLKILINEMLFSKSCYVIGYFKQGETGTQDTDVMGILLCLILCKMVHV